MADIAARLADVDWSAIERSLWDVGYARTPPVLTADECGELVVTYADEARFRSRVDMARFRFGVGEYKYFAAPLPPLVQALREAAYPPLAAIANQFEAALAAVCSGERATRAVSSYAGGRWGGAPGFGGASGVWGDGRSVGGWGAMWGPPSSKNGVAGAHPEAVHAGEAGLAQPAKLLIEPRGLIVGIGRAAIEIPAVAREALERGQPAGEREALGARGVVPLQREGLARGRARRLHHVGQQQRAAGFQAPREIREEPSLAGAGEMMHDQRGEHAAQRG